MMVAIPASKNNVNALIDKRFGRFYFFIFHNMKTNQTEFKETIHKNDKSGVGQQVAEFLSNNGINKVYAVEFGHKAKDMLAKLKTETQQIQKEQTICEIIEIFNPVH
jgi:predicted Fe-Mo cluster-binding NifX family protein